MTLGHIDLEDFDSGQKGPKPKSLDFRSGFEEGHASALNEISARQAQACEEILSALQDMRFGYEEARQQLISQLAPILAQVAEAVLPSVLRETFGLHLVEHVLKTAQTGTDTPIEVSVSETIVGQIQSIPALQTQDVHIKGRSDLVDGQALIVSGGAPVLLDLPHLLTELQTALRGLEGSERTMSHG